ncbi:sensory neuron membrane protein 2-like [Leguminivora glycinivorella]|uniref:sensory neuron membrane protein 2-like n=1 Tax=Leguminivora glycinivorella TaxID=1035111 RepID=UPI00200EE440|nr:sensory neuron membrane protein 2-like [Leguminivora glycinivorella]
MIGKQSRLFFLISLCGLMLAILLATWGIPKIVRSQIQKNVQIDPSSQMFDKWRKLPMPLTFKVYVFNVTNAEEISSGAKPELEEIGPYVYQQYRERLNLSYGENDTVEYMLKKTFVFDQKATGSLSEDDEVTVINFTYGKALLQVQELMPGLVGMINGALEEMFTNLTDPFLRVKVKDLFFDGIHLNCVGENSALGLVCGKLKSEKPPTMRPSEDGNGFYFSMFSHMNLTQTGPYQMIRGTKDLQELGHIVSYKGKKQMNKWKDPYCNQLNGSDASVFPPVEGAPPQRLYTFEPEVCRSLYANLVGPDTLFDMKAIYYEIGEDALAAKTANRDNKCFCRKNWSANHDGCLLMGVLNLEPCQNAPALATLPHFYLASEELLEYFAGGVNPDKEKHNTYVYLDPITGVVLKGVRRLQFNIELRQIKGIPQLENVRTGVFPLLWIDEGAELPPEIQQELKQSHTLLGYVEMGRWIMLSIAILVLLASLFKLARSGALPMCGQHTNSVSFVLSANGNGNKLR